MSVNKVILVGNVGKDPETRYIDESTAITKFPLATSETYKNRSGERISNTEWHNVVLWRGLAQVAEKYVKKGTQIYIEGRIKTRSYDDADGNRKYITEIVGDQLQLLGRKSDDASGGANQGETQAPQSNTEQAQAPMANAGQAQATPAEQGQAQAPPANAGQAQAPPADQGEAQKPSADPFDAGDNGPDDLPF
ncbi:MAG: single-stranded DNA-binding protein [Bacteroidota bacterium]